MPPLSLATPGVSPGASLGEAQPTPAAVAFSARVTELLAMFDRSGVVTAVNVEPLPDGRVGYALRLTPEARPVPGTPPAPLGTLVQTAAQVADLVVQGQGVGLVLRDVAGGGGPVASGRSEIAVLGSLLQEVVAKDARALPPVLSTIIRRAVDPEATNQYVSVREMRSDLVKLQQTIPPPTSGATIAFSRVAQSLGQLEFLGVVTVNGVLTMPDGRTGYGLRMLLDGSARGPFPAGATDDVLVLMLRLTDAVVQARDAGMLLREVTSRGVTVPLGAEARPELAALGTIFRDLMVLTKSPLAAPFAAMIDRALDPDAKERYEDVAELRGDLAAQHQIARLIPQPMSARLDVDIKSSTSRLWWFLLVTGLIVVAVLLFVRR